MQDSLILDEADLALVHALQLNPRVAWARLAGVLDVDASTLSRRWSRLSGEGLAWFTCYPANTLDWTAYEALAFVEVECVPGKRPTVVERLSLLAGVWNIDVTAGRRDLMLTVIGRSMIELDSEIVESVNAVIGVVASRTHFARRIFADGSDWRLDALSPAQQQAVTVPQAKQRALRPAHGDLELIHLLGPDARLPASRVAQRLGCSVSTASRRIERVIGSEFTKVRCEIAHYLAGWHVSATLWLDVPQQDLTSIATAIARLPHVRICATVVGQANLVAQIWLHRLEDLDQFEMVVGKQFGGTRVVDRWVTPRFAKRLGHIIGPDGRRMEFVPLGLGRSGDTC